jgi:hypothetical protein
MENIKMRVYEHQSPIDEPPTPSEIDNHIEEMEPENFVEWMIERKGKATRDYFIERWGIDPDDIDNAMQPLEDEGIVVVKQH